MSDIFQIGEDPSLFFAITKLKQKQKMGWERDTSPEPSLTLRILIDADYHKLRNFSDVLAQQIGIIYR